MKKPEDFVSPTSMSQGRRMVQQLSARLRELEDGWPKLGDELLGNIEACIIENTGDGELAAYVCKFLEGKRGNQ